MSREELLQALRRMAPETGSLNCLGCGHEHSCSTHGCAICREAIELIEQLSAEIDVLREKFTPLTVEELLEMDGKPIYVASFGVMKTLPELDSGFVMCFADLTDLDSYEKTWLAFRRERKGGGDS